MQRACDSCGLSYEAKRKASRFCSSRCRQRAQRGHVLKAPEPAVGTVSDEPAAPEPISGTEASVRAELEAVSRQASSLGVLALRLAGSIDAGGHTASGLAALSRELRAVMVDASANARPVVDPVDELSKRRTTKAASA